MTPLNNMQNHPLTTSMLINHAATNHSQSEIVSKNPSGVIQRTTWGQLAEDSKRFASALHELGLATGDRVASLAWNRTPHLTLYYGVTAPGFVLHTVNPRLFPEQIEYIINHGGSRILCVDPDLLPIVEAIAGRLKFVEKIVVLCSEDHIPETSIEALISFDTLINSAEALDDWPLLDENSASTLCYTSGTTGNPKGVLYSHRSTVLHSYAINAADAMALTAADNVLLVTPLFHVNAWGVPFASAMSGSKLILPGSELDPASIYHLMRDEDVTFSLGVPTVWNSVLDYLEHEVSRENLQRLRLNRVFVGGAAASRALISRFYGLLGVKVLHAWGMTETSPVATVNRPLAKHENLSREQMLDNMTTQGRPLCGVQLKVESQDGDPIPRGTGESGVLKVRGPWVINHYYRTDCDSAVDSRGWFDTGDMAHIDEDGYLHITDRTKDVIKSGGEWISSIDIENAAMEHPDVLEAAAIAVPHPRWQERPLLLLTLHEGRSLTKADMLDFLKPKMVSWWLPDDVMVVGELPHTPTGKLLKKDLRETHIDHYCAER